MFRACKKPFHLSHWLCRQLKYRNHENNKIESPSKNCLLSHTRGARKNFILWPISVHKLEDRNVTNTDRTHGMGD